MHNFYSRTTNQTQVTT